MEAIMKIIKFGMLPTLCAVTLILTGCASTEKDARNGSAAAGPLPSKFKTDDQRTIDIGPRSAADNGWSFKDPHLTRCWIADGFDFKGYETLFLAPTLCTAKYHDDEERPHQLAMENLVIELNRSLGTRNLFTNLVTNPADVKPGARVLKLENTIVEYSKGGGGARYWVGLYGGGQPVLRVQGVMTDGDKTVFRFEARRSGGSAGARLTGFAMKDEDIQLEDIRSMVVDLTDFISAIAGQYQPIK
jgi:hypothetical protein